MNNSNFVWTDLSTFEIDPTRAFYAKIFGWQYHDEDGYVFGFVGKRQSAGIYVMPDKFQQIGMPSFWMSYIQITNIEQVAAQAKESGGIVEIWPTDFGEGKIALIRDPAGAGFTVWEGPDFAGKDSTGTHGRMIWNELYVSDASLVIDFYRTLFGWSFQPENGLDGEWYGIHNGAGQRIAALQVISNEIKGKEEFWVPYFATTNLEKTLGIIEQEGGVTVDQSQSETGRLAIARDPQGAAFALMEYSDDTSLGASRGTHGPLGDAALSQRGSFRNSVNRRDFKWRTLLALTLLYIGVVLNLQWVWGLLFLLWLIPDLISGQTHLVEPISRSEHPVWYWLIIGTWLWMSVYLLMDITLNRA